MSENAQKKAHAVEPPWWTHPDRFVALIILPIAIVMCAGTAYLITNNQKGYEASIYLNSFYVTLFLSGIALIAVGAAIGERTGRPLHALRFADGCLDVLFWLCIAGYAVWFGPLALSSPQLLIGALRAEAGAVYEIRELAPNLSGVTTATQFGISYCCIYAFKRFVLDERPARRYALYFAVIFTAATLRAIVYSERIALIEIAFPVLVILCRGSLLTRALPLRIFRETLPLLLLLGSPLFFAAFEYNRSWVALYQYRYDSLWAFALERMGIYYVTSLNNICGFLDRIAWPTFNGEITFYWLYRFPLIGPLMTEVFGASLRPELNDFLESNGIEEFNNSTGILVAHQDWGVVGGSLFLLALGLFAGRAFRSFRELRGFLQYFYPVILYALFEILRIGYLYDGRSVAALIGLLIAYVGWGRVQSAPLPPRSGAADPPAAGTEELSCRPLAKKLAA
ncbi:MAG: hypothetical protein R3D62_03360 [Xanthobacteraceae bacterium]